MPRENKTIVSPAEGQPDLPSAFDLAKGSRPKYFESQDNADDLENTEIPARARTPKATEKKNTKTVVIRRKRQAATGRNIQFNQRVTPEIANWFYDTSEELKIPVAEVLERAAKLLKAELEKSKG